MRTIIDNIYKINLSSGKVFDTATARRYVEHEFGKLDQDVDAALVARVNGLNNGTLEVESAEQSFKRKEQENNSQADETLLQDTNEEKCCHVCNCNISNRETTIGCISCDNVVHLLCCQDSGRGSLVCNSCHLTGLKVSFRSLKELSLKLIRDIDTIYSRRQTEDTNKTLLLKVETAWRFLGTKLPKRQRKMVKKHLKGLLNGECNKKKLWH